MPGATIGDHSNSLPVGQIEYQATRQQEGSQIQYSEPTTQEITPNIATHKDHTLPTYHTPKQQQQITHSISHNANENDSTDQPDRIAPTTNITCLMAHGEMRCSTRKTTQ